MTVRNVKKNLAGQQDLLPGVGPYNQTRRGQAVTVDGPAKSYIELWKAYCGSAYAGTFEDGCTVSFVGAIVVSLTLGKAYSWQGTVPKDVPEDSTLASTGGVGAGAWRDYTASSLRAELASASGASLIGIGGGRNQEDKNDEWVSITDAPYLVKFDNVQTTLLP